MSPHHACMVVEEQSTSYRVQHHLHMGQWLQENVSNGDDSLAQQCSQLAHAVRGSKKTLAHGLQLMISKHLRITDMHS